jgi:hypothetical protein
VRGSRSFLGMGFFLDDDDEDEVHNMSVGDEREF